VKSLQYPLHPAWSFIDSHQKRFVMNMRLIHYLARAFQTEKNKKEKARFWLVFLIFKKNKCVKKAWISKFGLKNAKLATLHATSDCMRPPLLGRVTVASQGQVLDHRDRATKFVQAVLWFSCNYWRIIWFHLTCSWLISREAPSRFPHFLQPWPCNCATPHFVYMDNAE